MRVVSASIVRQVGQNLLLERHGDGRAGQRQLAQQRQQVVELVHLQRQQHRVHPFAAEGGVLHQRRERVVDGVAGHAEDARRVVELLDAVEVAQGAGGGLAGGGFRALGERGKGEGRAGAQAQHAADQPLLAHGDAHHLSRAGAILDQLQDGQVVGQRLGRRNHFDEIRAGRPRCARAACSRFLVREKS